MDPEAALARALHLHRVGDIAAAIAACRRATQGGGAVAARLLGLLLAEAGALPEARHWAARAVALDRSPETLAAEGRVLALVGQWAAAAAVLREALALQPGFTAARLLLDRAEAAAPSLAHEAQARFAAGRFAEAAGLFRDASLLRPRDAALLHALGTVLHEAGEPGAAADAYQRALALMPERVETWHNLGSARQALGDLPGAMDAYAHAYALDPACFPRIAQELAAGRAGQVWLSASALRARLGVTAHGHGTRSDTLPVSPAPRPPRP